MAPDIVSDIFVLASALASIVALAALGKISKRVDEIADLVTAYHKINKPRFEEMDSKLDNLLEVKKAKGSRPAPSPGDGTFTV